MQPFLLITLHPPQCLDALIPSPVCISQTAGAIIQPAVRVDHSQLRRGREKRLLLVLAMDVAEVSRQLPELAERGRRAIDISSALARGEHLPLENQLTGLVVIVAIFRCRLSRPVRRVVETAADAGLAGSCTDDIHAGTGTKEQRKRIDDDGLATAGLTRQEVETWMELNSEPVDDGVVFDVKFLKHSERPCVQPTSSPYRSHDRQKAESRRAAS